MTKLNWEKAALASKPKLSITAEREYLDRGYTARWLEQAEKRAAMRKGHAAVNRKARAKSGAANPSNTINKAGRASSERRRLS
jgi:hypothetical protein